MGQVDGPKYRSLHTMFVTPLSTHNITLYCEAGMSDHIPCSPPVIVPGREAPLRLKADLTQCSLAVDVADALALNCCLVYPRTGIVVVNSIAFR